MEFEPRCRALHTVAVFTHIAKCTDRQTGQFQVTVVAIRLASALGTDSLHDFSSQGLKAIGDLVPYAAPRMGAEDVRNE